MRRARTSSSPPLAARRLRERGFNQALELARVVGRALALPVEFRAMGRSDTPAQTGLTRAERLDNLRGAFTCGRDLRERHVAIIDDVITTGATIEAFSQALRVAGAVRVDAWALARSPAPGE